MAIRPSGIIFVNNDLTTSVQNMLVKQLHINDVFSGDEFDAIISLDPTYPDKINQLDRRVLVIRPFTEDTNRSLADVVGFVSHGLISIEKNNFGPPGITSTVVDLTWGKLCIF